MTTRDLLKQLIYTTLTLNSTTLYATENTKLTALIPSLNCSELVSLELGLINASKTLIGLLSVVADRTVTKLSLLLYFMKKLLQNPDGGFDLVTVVVLAHQDVNKTLVLAVLKKIIDKYFEFRLDLACESITSEHAAKVKLGEFKLYMNQIIKFEEVQYDLNLALYSYGATRNGRDNNAGSPTPNSEIITPNQLVSANEDVDEVRLLMLDNINKILGRGDRIGTLVDQTERLQASSLILRKNAASVKRKMWFNNARSVVLIATVSVSCLYLVLGFECGYPFFQTCLRH
ncbi:synaptobrevin-domain-containing protein [Metschnikowia bicuspidata var. bicuspidata NRRL YB-4993]|uniref:Synaptobrevin-domain-containing protein n=1 Tax=Metschnikowia bicuspidata var. bicuspidata NRRL YB-4993 TaxID=869754 RepID=A0A1A0HJ21_9ASCO|nr:synaptobrevin-domain-containing protein [Metschnikowia bicuspidata var. bicuspidata NRRL YB-4993]OBA24154.1 synaptobrevin-domain-containing protein [Metschnikowia bicuspidata var. bicuspidata NRRL YB-4993]